MMQRRKESKNPVAGLTQTIVENKKLVLPCLRGALGSWVTYTCLMRLSDIGSLVHFAKEVHSSKKLSEMIQRNLESGRSREIADYLLTNPDRFFNSLVLGIYAGEPQWLSIERIQPQSDEAKQVEMPDYAQECLGFLTLTRKEQLFALDGQHRLAGIKQALASGTRLGEEQLTVVIVVHEPTPEGVKRSRRLFTTLNKKAKLVTKDAIIALDEDDISASITRRMLEESGLFNEDNVSFKVGQLRDNKSITTIGNIYDCTEKVVAHFLGCSTSGIEKTFIDEPEKVWEHVREFYRLTFEHVPALRSLVSDGNSTEYVRQYRNSQNGGHLLFRPIGWEIYTDAVLSLLSNGKSLEQAVAVVTTKDLSLSGPVFAGKVWSTQSKRIMNVPSKTWRALINDLT